MGYDVFLSYVRGDQEFADDLVSSLTKRNIRCWIDHKDLPLGLTWDDEIFKAITENPGLLMLVLLSEKTLLSKEVAREVRLADDNNVHIIPVRIKDVKLTGALAFRLNGKHRIDAFGIGIDSIAERISDVVKKNNIREEHKQGGKNEVLEPNINKYQPLREYLEKTPPDNRELTLSFKQIEEIINSPLPNASYRHTAWWANDVSGIHPNANAWLAAGWKRSKLNLDEKYVVFIRV
ncbi:TIR protein [Candidatus Magnetobacterium bavaricum]|uniref:TIR protein n=1 Tax=Candidatus Magnetobacterium bavaricum TaxID=29290 RepID=A0A0F3GP34_9BACT|nr:TIR protein [Candidatus Magnetobacterium bavaricum]